MMSKQDDDKRLMDGIMYVTRRRLVQTQFQELFEKLDFECVYQHSFNDANPTYDLKLKKFTHL